MKRILLVMGLVLVQQAVAESQVFYRFGASKLSKSRGGQIFTDTAGATMKNDDDTGKSFGAGLNLKMFNCPIMPDNSVFGEIFIEYNRFSNNKVTNAINVLSGAGPSTSEVSVSELAVIVAPKYKFHTESALKPWVIPLGLAFLVNSPPSDTTSYLDIGYHGGIGADYYFAKILSLGLDLRHTFGFGHPQYAIHYTSLAANIGFNF